ncbi:MAG: hypothetical protein VX278_16530 [Myxococcota bacterium]|nr:hypothetical protein [Myxococcota bacterium]
MSTRRELLRKIGMSTAGLVMVSGFRVGSAQAGIHGKTSFDAPWWLFEPLAKGSYLANQWFLSDLSPIEKGAAILTLSAKDDRQARIHICGHAGSPKGIAHTKYLDLLLMDGGDGNTPSNESLGRVILSLAKHIENTESLLEQSSILSRFALHEDRLLLYKDQGLI